MRSEKAQMSTKAQKNKKNKTNQNSQPQIILTAEKNEVQRQQPPCTLYINRQAIAPRDGNFSLPHIILLRRM